MRIAMVTGPSSGIGRATALELAGRGFHVVAAGRSEERTVPVVEAIVAAGGSAEFLPIDLASLASVATAAASFNTGGRLLDVLVANAGVGGRTGLTEDGFELHFGVNHLGHFLLTLQLGPALRPGSRVVVVSSEAHRGVERIDYERVRRSGGLIASYGNYAVSKLANILFTRELAQRDPELRTYSLHPGVVDTGIFPAIARPFFRNRSTPEEGAETSVWCATAEELADSSGLYYSRREVREPSAAARDDRHAAELWARSEEWCALASPR